VFVPKLERVDDSEELGEVSSSRSGVRERQTDDLLGVDDKDGSDSEWDTLLVDIGLVEVVEHAIESGDFSAFIGDDWEIEAGSVGVQGVNVLDPAGVRVDIVGGKADQLDTSRLKVGVRESNS